MLNVLQKLNRPWVALLVVGLLAGGLRLWHVTYPETRIFDEYYYPKSACIFLGYSNERCDINSSDERYWRGERGDTGAWVHPPLGKWAIALGELAFGTDSFGWRFSGVVFGTASVVLLAGIVQLLFRKPIWTFTAGLLLATESLNFVQSRTSMLDIFVTAWIVAGFLLLLLDRRWIDRRTPYPEDMEVVGSTELGVSRPTGSDPTADPAPAELPAAASPPVRVPEPLWRPWRFGAGVAFGCAVATKWSGLTAIVTAIVLSLLWERTRRKRLGMKHPTWRTFQSEGFGLVLSMLLVPAIVYVASYTAWFIDNGWSVTEWMRLQGAIASYHEGLKVLDSTGKPIHPYLAQAWKWILLWRPVLYYARYPVEGLRKVIYANGNPAIFWGSILAIPYAAVQWRRRRDWRAGFVVMTIAGLYVPWFLVSRPQFFFYATPMTPFLVLACVYALKDVSEMHLAGSKSRPYLPFVVGSVIVSVALFIWFWPVLTGGPLSDAAFRLRNWFPTWT